MSTSAAIRSEVVYLGTTSASTVPSSANETLGAIDRLASGPRVSLVRSSLGGLIFALVALAFATAGGLLIATGPFHTALGSLV